MNVPLALIHGWGQHGGIWRTLLAELETELASNFDLPGHGDAPPEAYDLDTLVDTYAKRGPPACNLIGWSLGGMLALRWAQRYPQQVKKLVLFSATPCFGERAGWPHGSPQAIQDAFAAQVAAAPERSLQRFADLLAEGEADVRGVRKALRAILAEKAVPPVDMLMAGLRFLSKTDLRIDLETKPVIQPALVIHGEGDTITPFAAGQWLAATLPQARLLALPQCGHAPMVSHLRETSAAIEAFLKESV